MRKHTLWMVVVCVIPIFLLFLLQAFQFGEIINDVILLAVLVIILMIMPKDIEDAEIENEKAVVKPSAKSKKQFVVSPKNLGLAIGITFVLLHLGCIFIMYYLGQAGTVSFFNNMFHGMDFSGVVKMNVPLTEVLAGAVELFIVGTFIGICIAGLYNNLFRTR